jgi:hypothetical protein
VVKYLCERGGERLLMLTDNVSVLHMLCVSDCWTYLCCSVPVLHLSGNDAKPVGDV